MDRAAILTVRSDRYDATEMKYISRRAGPWLARHINQGDLAGQRVGRHGIRIYRPAREEARQGRAVRRRLRRVAGMAQPACRLPGFGAATGVTAGSAAWCNPATATW